MNSYVPLGIYNGNYNAGTSGIGLIFDINFEFEDADPQPLTNCRV